MACGYTSNWRPKEDYHFGVIDHDIQVTVVFRRLKRVQFLYGIRFAATIEGKGQS